MHSIATAHRAGLSVLLNFLFDICITNAWGLDRLKKENEANLLSIQKLEGF